MLSIGRGDNSKKGVVLEPQEKQKKKQPGMAGCRKNAKEGTSNSVMGQTEK